MKYKLLKIQIDKKKTKILIDKKAITKEDIYSTTI